MTIFFSHNIYSQVTVENDSVYEVHDTNEEDVTVHNFHSAPSPITTVKWTILSIEVETGWENDAFICDAVQCYDTTKNSNEYDLEDSKKKSLDVHFINNSLTGDGKVKLLIWDVADSLNTVKTVTYVVKIEAPSAINSVEDLQVGVFPNPTTKYINVNNVDLSLINKIEVYNVIGKKVYYNQNISKDNRIDINDFQKGVYIIKLLGSENQTYYTKNIIKK